jgi:hypothetical protein
VPYQGYILRLTAVDYSLLCVRLHIIWALLALDVSISGDAPMRRYSDIGSPTQLTNFARNRIIEKFEWTVGQSWSP